MSTHPFKDNAKKYWDVGLSEIPVKKGTKRPSISKWQNFQTNLPTLEQSQQWLRQHENNGIGILTGTEIIAGHQLVAIDVDDDKLVPLVKSIVLKYPCCKRGKKGLTIFCVAPKSESFSSTTLRGGEGLGNIDVLVEGRFTVLPPTIHPDTKQAYVWEGKNLLEVDFNLLPIVNRNQLNLLKKVVESNHTATIISGKMTNDASLRLSSTLVATGASDDDIMDVFSGLLPPDYTGDTMEELQGMIEGARKKGFDTLSPSKGQIANHSTGKIEFSEINKNGIPRQSLSNAIVACLLLELKFEHDLFHNRMRIEGHILQTYQGELSDKGIAALRKHILDKFYFDPGKQFLQDAVQILCIHNAHHPIIEYIDGLEWDEKQRLDAWLIDYLGAEDTILNRVIGKIMLVAAVRRVRQPGCKFDTMVVFEGEQGSGKSTALLILAGEENFSDQNLFALDDKAQMEALEGVWIFEVAELDGITRAETSKIKALISRTEDRARPAYARFKESVKRQCILVGTTNEFSYLKDTTGNRRFLPVKTNEINLEALRCARDQLWAEANAEEAKGHSITLPKQLWQDAAVEQEGRMQEDPWMDILSKANGIVKDGFERIATEQLFGENYLNLAPAQRQPYHPKRLATVMRKLGWKGPIKLRISGVPLRGYQRPIDAENDVQF